MIIYEILGGLMVLVLIMMGAAYAMEHLRFKRLDSSSRRGEE